MGKLVIALCESEKSRLGSHLWSAYATPEGRKRAVIKGLVIDTGFSAFSINKNFFIEGDPQDIQPYANFFYYRLTQRNPNCVGWLSYYMLSSEKAKVKTGLRCDGIKNRRTNPMIIIWIMLLDLATEENIKLIELLKTCYFDYSETRPFIMLAVMVILYDIKMTLDKPTWFTNNVHISKYLVGQYSFIVDDDMIDKHTREGKREAQHDKNL